MDAAGVATVPSMHDEDTLEDSWFDRPARAQALTRDAVMRALADPSSLGEPEHAPGGGAAWEGLQDSWFDRPPRELRR